MLGHKGGGGDSALSLDHAYYRPSAQDLLSEYRKATSGLTIAEESASEIQMKRDTILSVIEILGYDHGIKEKVRAIFDESPSYETAIERTTRFFRLAGKFREIRAEQERARSKKSRGS
jgi:hypothetical protein